MDAATYGKLTARERGVLLAASAGQSAKEVGQALGISHRTVEDALYSARTKLGVTRSVVAGQMLLAYEAQLKQAVEIPEPRPVAENLAERPLTPAFQLADALPTPQPSQASANTLREMPLAFEFAATGADRPDTRRRLTDAVPPGVLVMLATAIGVPLVLAILTILYLGLSTIERVSLLDR